MPLSITLSLVENKLNKYTFKYNIPKSMAVGGLQSIWLEYTDSNNSTKSIQGPGWPGNYPLTGTIVATLPPHKTFSIRLSVKPLQSGNILYSNTINLSTYGGKIDPPLNVVVQPINTSRSSGNWEVLLTWNNSKNIGSAPVSKLKILYTYNAGSARSTYYSKIVDINEWDSSNSYTWTFSAPYKNSSKECHFSLAFINEAGEESEKADSRHNLGPGGLSNNLFAVVNSWKPDVTISATPLFNESSWTNNTLVDSFIKTYLNIASNRWSKYIGIDIKTAEKIKSIDPKFYNGIYLNKYTTINDSSKPIMQCIPAKYVSIKLNDGRWNFITVSFNLVFNKYYENNSDRASNWDLINSTTHHLGHALGIGVYWHLDQLYDTSSTLKSDTIAYPRYRLDGNLFPQTQLIHNALYRAEDFYGWILKNISNPEPTLRLLTQPPIKNSSTGITCKNFELKLPCVNTTPIAQVTSIPGPYGYPVYNVSNIYEPSLSRRVYTQNRRFIPLDQIGSLTTDNIKWEELNDSNSPTAPLELWQGDKNQPFVSGLSADENNENFPGCHFGLVDNPLNRRLFTYNHRELNDIMLYRTVVNNEGNSGSYPQKISALSIAHLKDLGYVELYENQKPGPSNLRVEDLSDWADGYTTSKLNNHSCCRGFSPSQIESWQPQDFEFYARLSNEDIMLKIADIINDIVYCYADEEGC